MSTLLRSFIAGCLALCFAFAGAVGTNPLLHRLVEHSGQGAAHVHSGFDGHASHSSRHEHGDGQRHSHAPASPPPARLFVHDYERSAPHVILLSKLWQDFRQWLGSSASSDAAPENSAPDHEHHSLCQLLASGLVEQPLQASLLPVIPLALITRDFAAHTSFVAHDWDAQTAPRGPPVLPS